MQIMTTPSQIQKDLIKWRRAKVIELVSKGKNLSEIAENFLASLDVYNSEPFSKNRIDMQLPKVDLAQDSGISRAAEMT